MNRYERLKGWKLSTLHKEEQLMGQAEFMSFKWTFIYLLFHKLPCLCNDYINSTNWVIPLLDQMNIEFLGTIASQKHRIRKYGI